MNYTWQRLQDANGVIPDPEDDVYDPARIAMQTDYHWTPACQRAFLEALATTGSVTRASKEVNKSPRAAYGLKFRKQGYAFKIAWDASILVARDVLGDMLLDRAVNGFEETSFKDADGTTTRGKFDNGLSSRVLGRLDIIAEKQSHDHTYAAKVQMAVQDYEMFLELIEIGGGQAEAEAFFAAQYTEQSQQKLKSHTHAVRCELAQKSAADAVIAEAEKAAENTAKNDPQAAIAKMSVWYNAVTARWCTNFPPPPEFDVYTAGTRPALQETGKFGEPSYARLLTFAEIKAHETNLLSARSPLLDSAYQAREAFFGIAVRAGDDASA
jgi:hypothetical protein